jgi:hypothetical protein
MSIRTYLGRLDPQPGHGSALISRYFTQPLLDLVDIGIYAIGLRAEVAPSPACATWDYRQQPEC